MRFLDVSKKIILFSMMAFLVSLGVPPPDSAADIVIKLGACFDITGPYADPGFLKAYQGVIKSTNESGGFKDVKGQTCKLELMWKDGQSKVPDALVAYKEFKSAGCVVHSYSSTSQYMALRRQAMKDKIPMSSQAVTNLTIEGDAGAWLYGQMGNREAVICGLDGLKKIWKKDRPPKVGFFGWDNLLGYDHVPFAKRYAKILGFEVGPDEYFAMDALDVSPQLKRLHGAKCDYVFEMIAGGQHAIIVKNRYRLGYHRDMRFICLPPITGAAWTVTKKMNPKMYNGDIAINGYCVPEEDKPDVKRMKEIQKKYDGGVNLDEWGQYQWGYSIALGIVEAVKRALQKVPGDKLTPADVYEYGFKDFKMDLNGLTKGFHFTRYNSVLTGMRLCEMRDGLLVPMTDWIPLTYRAPDAPDAPAWIKEVGKEVAEAMKKRKKKK